jgi:glycosyltransferase involved in cell wall biosynthesis
VTRTVLHVLPHRGGGAETYIDLLEGIDGFEHERIALSAGRTPRAGAASIGPRYPLVARRVAAADVVHAHGDAAAALALPLLVRRPSVWTTHGLHLVRRASGPLLPVLQSALRRAIANTARTICTSQAERDELAALLRSPSRRLVVVRNGIEPPPAPSDELRAAVRDELAIDAGDLAVLFLGELEQRKRPLDAIAAAQRARRDGAPVVLLVAGDGPQAEAVRAHAGEAVRPLGFRTDVPRLLAAADVLVMPSEREGLSFAVIEAMGSGLAIVVSDGPGNPEAIGDAGIVVGLGDVDALAATLGELARDPAQLRRLGIAARRRVLQTLTADSLRGGVAAAYHAALQQP